MYAVRKEDNTQEKQSNEGIKQGRSKKDEFPMWFYKPSSIFSCRGMSSLEQDSSLEEGLSAALSFVAMWCQRFVAMAE